MQLHVSTSIMIMMYLGDAYGVDGLANFKIFNNRISAMNAARKGRKREGSTLL